MENRDSRWFFKGYMLSHLHFKPLSDEKKEKKMERSQLTLKVQEYLTHWAPHLLFDSSLVDLLIEAGQEASESDGQEAVHIAIHGYFVTWCAVMASDKLSNGGASFRKAKTGEIWGLVRKNDIFARREFEDCYSVDEALQTWFSSRLDEIMEMISVKFPVSMDLTGEPDSGAVAFRRGEGEDEVLYSPEAIESIAILGEWLAGGFKEEDEERSRKMRILVRTIAFLRSEFGTAGGTPEVPVFSAPKKSKAQSTEEKTRTQNARANARAFFQKLNR